MELNKLTMQPFKFILIYHMRASPPLAPTGTPMVPSAVWASRSSPPFNGFHAFRALLENAVRINTKSTIFCWFKEICVTRIKDFNRFQQIWENNCKIYSLCYSNQQSEHLSVDLNRGILITTILVLISLTNVILIIVINLQ
jgi:hypothetical protein